jgi:2-C-methyl-D-erythritol 4-phosphate cytidylyltransferase
VPVQMSKYKVTAVLLTGGEGRRFKDAELPKQFIEICGNPLFIYSIDTYESIAEVDEICLVINNDYKHIYENLLRRYSFNKLGPLVKGGLFRQQSVRNALELITHDGLVVIQNGVNPMTPAHLIKGCIREAYMTGAATAYVPASHTVFEMNDQTVQHVLDRNVLGYTCDPQAYRVDVIKKALLRSKDENKDIPTVDLVKRIGHPVGIVRSDETNIKLTTNADLSIIRNLIESRCMQ